MNAPRRKPLRAWQKRIGSTRPRGQPAARRGRKRSRPAWDRADFRRESLERGLEWNEQVYARIQAKWDRWDEFRRSQGKDKPPIVDLLYSPAQGRATRKRR